MGLRQYEFEKVDEKNSLERFEATLALDVNNKCKKKSRGQSQIEDAIKII